MRQFEYKRMTVKGALSETIMENLNKIGAEGWQLVAPLKSTSGGQSGLFMREYRLIQTGRTSFKKRIV